MPKISLMLLVMVLLAACSGGEKKDPSAQKTDEPTPVAMMSGNPERGAEIFTNGVDGAPPCTSCHAVEPKPSRFTVAPNLGGISDRAEDRVPDLSAEEYLSVSILRPGAYVVNGFNNAMYSDYAKHLSSQDVSDLIAFLMTL
ncbi:MAG: c-type cytochrome [Anaerolineae bacterium]|nr:MAG: cytochrome c [Anaerolineae bacterium]MCL4879512.1 c-type cytochrome [Anaerolineae bacterium]